MAPPPRSSSSSTTTTTTTTTDGGAELWLYVDATTGQQRGPLPEATLKRLLRRGLVTPQQLVWTKRLAAWAPLASTEPLATYCRVWLSYWYYMVESGDGDDAAGAGARQGPVLTKDLVALFLDGVIDGLTLVWAQDLADWKPIGEVPALKEFLHEANEDQDREAEAMEAQERVTAEDQVFEEASVEAFVAEDGKEYVFDAETKKWVTPEDKIQEDLDALREAAGADDNGDDRHKKRAPKAPAPPALPSPQPIASSSSPNVQANVPTAGEAADVVAATTPAADSANGTNNDKKRKKKKKSEKWRKSKTNTWVYVNGLPLDITLEEVHDHFAKCGVVQTDLVTGAPRIKLYENKDYGGLNGDGSVCYMKEASVELAVQLLDKSQIRPEWTIDVSPAVFEQKGEAFVKRKKLRLDSRARVKQIEQQKALSWNEGEDGDRSGLRIVAIKHMFTPDEIEDEAYEQELREDIEVECAKIGEITKLTLFSKHPDGVVVIKFASSGSAAKCVDIMNGRFFAGRKLVCQFWDGTDYTTRETKDEEKERAEKFDEWLNEGSSSDDEAESEDDEAGARVDAHPGRVVPNEAAEEEDPEEDNDVPAGEEVHAGRVMPALDDSDDDDDDGDE